MTATLLDIIAKGNVEEFEKYLSDIKTSDADRLRACFLVVKKNWIGGVDSFLKMQEKEKCLDKPHPDYPGMTLAMFAVMHHQYEIAKKLANAGADPHIVSKSKAVGCNVLQMLLLQGTKNQPERMNCIQAFLEARHPNLIAALSHAKIYQRLDWTWSGYTALHMAAFYQLEAVFIMIKELYDAARSGEIKDGEKICSVESFEAKVINPIVDRSTGDFPGLTPLMIAVLRGNKVIVGQLSNSGADPSIICTHGAPERGSWIGYNAIQIAVLDERAQKIPALFKIMVEAHHPHLISALKYGKSLGSPLWEEYTAIHIAAYYNLVDAFDALYELKKAVDNQRLFDGKEICTSDDFQKQVIGPILNRERGDYPRFTPLMIAVECGHERVVASLVRSGVDRFLQCDRGSWKGYDAWRMAAFRNKQKIFSELYPPRQGHFFPKFINFSAQPSDQYLELEVPTGEFCLLYAVTLGFLLSAVDNADLFQKRFLQLFEADNMKQEQAVRDKLKEFTGEKIILLPIYLF